MISIIVPTYNESKNILKFYKNIKKIKFKYELIFVDDRSTDNSTKIFQKIKNKKVKFIIRKSKKRDLSRSVILGVKNAKYDNVMIMDCDLQHSFNDTINLKKKFFKDNLDLVIGSRFLKKKYFGNIFLLRSISSLLFILFINLFFKKETTDPLSGFFICKKKIILNNKKNYFIKGYKILFDIIYNSNCEIIKKDVQINFKKRIHGKSKLNIRIVLIFIRQIIYTKLR